MTVSPFVIGFGMEEQAVTGLLWACVMNAVEWNKKEGLVTEQTLKYVKVGHRKHTATHTARTSYLDTISNNDVICYE